MCPYTFVSVIKRAAPTGVFILLTPSLLAGCTSMTNDTLSDPSASQSGAAVPGEKMSDDQRYAPGPMGSGNVRWLISLRDGAQSRSQPIPPLVKCTRAS